MISDMNSVDDICAKGQTSLVRLVGCRRGDQAVAGKVLRGCKIGGF